MIVTTEVGTYERKTFRVRALCVTNSNMQQIAEWVEGEVVNAEKRRPFIRVSCGSKKENRMAFVGDWITNLVHYNDGETPEEPNYRVYNNHTFLQAFQRIMAEEEKYAKVHELLMKVRTAQDTATYHGESSEGVLLLIEQVAREICSIV
jgi:hypothetical protein